MTDLSTTYAGLRLRNPLVVSPSPLCEELDNIRRMEDAGAAAVVLHSLFEEQIRFESRELDHYLTQGTESFAEALTYFPNLGDYRLGPEEYLEHVRRAKEAVDIPVFGSLNGVTPGGWLQYAGAIQEAGADALELNIYAMPTDPQIGCEQIEGTYARLVREVKGATSAPVAVKLSPYFSSMPRVARLLDEAGADALVLFNRFYQPDVDPERLEVVPHLELSDPKELRLRLRWAAILYGTIRPDLAITGGVHAAQDVAKALMVGARVAMMTSALLTKGIDHLAAVARDLAGWMERHEYASVSQMEGSLSQKAVAEPAAFERANYMKVLRSYEPGATR